MGKSFEDLNTWKESRKYRQMVSATVKSFPVEEKYLLVNQLLRSSRSVTANIAEGHGRFHYQENIQFCRQARGSLMESHDHLICALDEQYITENEFLTFKTQYETCLKLINGYISYLKKRKENDRK